MEPLRNPPANGIPQDELRLITRAAWLYYIQGMTQTEVAEELNVSRIKVTRLIARAKSYGIVDIRIHQPSGMFVDLEEELISRYNLRDASVILDIPNGEPIRRLLAKATAEWLTSHLRPELVVGISMGRTLACLPDVIESNQPTGTTFIEVMGASDSVNSGFNSYSVISRIAQLYGGQSHLLDVPTFVSNQSIRDLLMSEEHIAERFEIARHCDILITSVGTVDDDALLHQIGYLPDDILHQLQNDHAVGDLLGHFIDERGRPVSSPLDGRLMAIQLDDLKHIPYSVLVSGGESKINAMKAALLGNYINVLITDVISAKELLKKN
ncbi:MAG: sugar-binding transcriptional regulator [Anaerolineaceae bacterium]